MKITPETPNSINMQCYDGDQLLNNVVEIDCEKGYCIQYAVDENGKYVISNNAIHLKTIRSKNLRVIIKEQSRNNQGTIMTPITDKSVFITKSDKNAFITQSCSCKHFSLSVEFVDDKEQAASISDTQKAIINKHIKPTVKELVNDLTKEQIEMKTKLVPANLTVETFIQRTMAGEVFYFDAAKFHYDGTKSEPFRLDNVPLQASWEAVPILCTREPITWQDKVSEDSPMLCWVSDNNSSDKVRTDFITGVDSKGFYDTPDGFWKYATPVKPSECWGFDGEGE